MRSQVGGASSYRKHIRAFIMSCWGVGSHQYWDCCIGSVTRALPASREL